LRRIKVWDEESERIFALLTNHVTFGAMTVTSIYKDRWQVEAFFATMRQKLKIKTFVRISRNALLTQLGTALFAILVFKYLFPIHAWLVTVESGCHAPLKFLLSEI
jgi:IS4 transposase